MGETYIVQGIKLHFMTAMIKNICLLALQLIWNNNHHTFIFIGANKETSSMTEIVAVELSLIQSKFPCTIGQCIDVTGQEQNHQ